MWVEGGERTDTELHLLQLIDPWPRPTPAKLTFAEATKLLRQEMQNTVTPMIGFLLWSAQTGKIIILKNLLFL